MGQFLDSAAIASGTGGGTTPTPTNGKKSPMVPTGGGTIPITIPPVSSVMSAFASGGTRVYLSIEYLLDL
jgi:hypothetical protein